MVILTETLINLDTEKFCKIWLVHVGIMLAKNVNVVLACLKRKHSPGCCFARHLTINKTIASEGQSQMTASVTSGD